MLKTVDLFDLSQSAAGEYLAEFSYPWEALSGLKEEIERIGESLAKEEYCEIAPKVWVHKTAKIAPTAYLGAPCVIGAGTEVRHCAFIRGSALIGENCVVGNSAEVKTPFCSTARKRRISITWAIPFWGIKRIWARAR